MELFLSSIMVGVLLVPCFAAKVETPMGTDKAARCVMNPDLPRDGTGKLRVKEVLTIGDDEEGEALIYRPIEVKADSNGRIYIYDFGFSCLKVFDSAGRFLRKIGGKGQGPGEFSGFISFVLLENDRIGVLDGRQKRITIFDSSGKILKDLRLEVKGLYRRLRSGPGNRLYIMTQTYRERSIPTGRHYLQPLENHLYGSGPEWKKWRELVSFEGEYFIHMRQALATGGVGIVGTSSPYSVVWNITPGGDVMAGLNRTYLLGVFSPEGKLKFRFGLDYQPGIKKNLKWLKKELPDQYKMFQTVPAFDRRIVFDEGDRIWIRRHDENYKIGRRINYDIFSPQGEFVKKIASPFIICYFNNRKIYGLFCPAEGEQWVVKSARLVHPPAGVSVF